MSETHTNGASWHALLDVAPETGQPAQLPTTSVSTGVDGDLAPDPDERALLLLAERYPKYQSLILSSDRLLVGLRALREASGASPDTIAADVGARELDTAQRPVGVLVSRCSELVAAAGQSPRSQTGDDHIVSGPARSPGVDRDGSPIEAGTHQRARRVPGPVPSPAYQWVDHSPGHGWRRHLRRATGGLITLGPGSDERIEQQLTRRARVPITGYRHVSVLSMRGGAGTTTTTVMLGHMFAALRGDRVVALDASANPGTLAYRIPSRTTRTVTDLLQRQERLERYAEVREFANQATSRLEVVASNCDPENSQQFSAQDYVQAAEVLDRFYNLIITDTGQGLLHDGMNAVLTATDQIVVLAAPSIDGGRSGALTLDWLDAHGYADLVTSAVVVVNAIRTDTAADLSGFVKHFGQRCRRVLEVPWDAHLGMGGETSLDALRPPTHRAYLELAAAVADGFPHE